MSFNFLLFSSSKFFSRITLFLNSSESLSKFNSSEIFKQSLKIIIIYILLTFLIFIILKLINLRTFDAFNFSLTLISSGGFLPFNNIDIIFQTDLSKLILSILMLISFFSLFLVYNLFFFKKKNISYLSEDFNLLIYLLVVLSFVFIFLTSANSRSFPVLQ